MALRGRVQQVRHDVAAPQARFGGTRGRLLAVLAVAVGTGVSLLRQPGPGALNTIWAEDGEIFLSQAVQAGAGAFTTSYAGYYHTVVRAVAGVVALLPAQYAAAALAVAGALVTMLFALSVFVLSAEYLPSTLARLIVSVPVAVLPMAQGDVLNSPANIHWTGLYLLFWLLICRPATAVGRILAVTGIVLVVSSDIIAGVYLPLAVFLVWFHRDRYAVIKVVALGVTLAGQVIGLLTGASERDGLAGDPVQGVSGYILRAVPTTLFGERWVGRSVTTTGLILAVLAWLLVATAVLLAVRSTTFPRWGLATAAAVHSVALYFVPVTLSGISTPRYNVAPALLALVSLVAVLRPKDTKIPISVLAGLLLVVCAVNLRVGNARAHGPAWSDELDRARATCATKGSGDLIEIPITPTAAPGWHAILRCDYLTGQ